MKLVLLVLVFVLLSFVGCTNAGRSQISSYGSDFKVTLYSGGQSVKTWTSNGKVLSEDASDGWYFNDKATGKLVRVSGNVTVEQL